MVALTVGLSGSEKAKIITVYTIIGLATTLGFLASAIVGKLSVLLAGLGIIAYVFGLRHGVDAGYRCFQLRAVLTAGDQNPSCLRGGLCFCLGRHPSCSPLSREPGSSNRYRTHTGTESGGAIIGTTVSGTFLLLMGIVNMVIVVNIYRLFKEIKQGRLDKVQLETLLDKRGFLNRYFRPLFRIVSRPWQIYPIGVLFGLGFDTATEVALIAISVGIGVSSSVPIWMILVLPFMFTCGMVLIDTTDGVTMRGSLRLGIS